LIEFTDVKRIHCIGIGGIGLSAIAEILLNDGYEVSGSDMKEGETTDRLIERGAKIYLGHRAKNITGADLVVYSAAVPKSNPELAEAREKGIKAVTRAELLGALMQRKPYSVAVAGAHGKTTTTSLISLILKEGGKDPTILVGGNLAEIDGNVRVGSGDYFVTEACEYMDSFLNLSPKYAIILNIDSDHLDYFKDIDHIVRSFQQFANLAHEDGAVIAFDANPFVSSILTGVGRRVITYGFHDGCEYSAKGIEFGPDGMPSFTIVHDGKELQHINLSIPGQHNISNALAAFACCYDMGLSAEQIAGTLENFMGTQRRFELLGETTDGVRIVDDYAHHPTEIKATIAAAQRMQYNNLWVIFQPHTYTRTMALHDSFAEELDKADKVIIADIYAARESNPHDVSSSTIVDKMKENDPTKDVWHIDSFEGISEFALKFAEQGDLIIVMGAGDIREAGDMILSMDQEKYLKKNMEEV